MHTMKKKLHGGEGHQLALKHGKPGGGGGGEGPAEDKVWLFGQGWWGTTGSSRGWRLVLKQEMKFFFLTTSHPARRISAFVGKCFGEHQSHPCVDWGVYTESSWCSDLCIAVEGRGSKLFKTLSGQTKKWKWIESPSNLKFINSRQEEKWAGKRWTHLFDVQLRANGKRPSVLLSIYGLLFTRTFSEKKFFIFLICEFTQASE